MRPFEPAKDRLATIVIFIVLLQSSLTVSKCAESDSALVFIDVVLPPPVQYRTSQRQETYVTVSDPDGVAQIRMHGHDFYNNESFIAPMWPCGKDQDGNPVFRVVWAKNVPEDGTPLNHSIWFTARDKLGNEGVSENYTFSIRRGVTEEPMLVRWLFPDESYAETSRQSASVWLYDPDGIERVTLQILDPWNWTWMEKTMGPAETTEDGARRYGCSFMVRVPWNSSYVYYTYRVNANDTEGNQLFSHPMRWGLNMPPTPTTWPFPSTSTTIPPYTLQPEHAVVVGAGAVIALIALVAYLRRGPSEFVTPSRPAS
jgi:hypothetical protein